jgi:DNA-binding NarL/FixJ family response regulator
VTDSSAPITLLLVEDNDVYRESLVFLLRRAEEVEVVGAVADGASALRACDELRPDVAVLDYRLPDLNGGVVAAELAARSPSTAVVFLSASAGEEEYDAASSTGAPLVRKDAGVDALVGAVRAAAGR